MRMPIRMPLLIFAAFLLLLSGTFLFSSQTRTISRNTPQYEVLSVWRRNVEGGDSLPPLTAEHLRQIMHAGGVTPDGQKETNSLEALNFSYSQGYRVMEIDFVWTADGELVCVHDFDSYYTSRITGAPRPTLAQFEDLRASTYSYTSLTLAALAQWMQEHPESYIVTDVKEDPLLAAQVIAQRYPHLMQRLIIQIYGEAEYAAVAQLGYPNIIYTLYALPYEDKMDTERLVAFSRTCPNLIGLTFSEEIAAPAYLSALKEGGVPLFVHTVDAPEVQENCFQMGVAGVYTNTGGVRGMESEVL